MRMQLSKVRPALVLRVLLGAAGLAVLGNGLRGLLTGTHAAALGSIGHWLLGGLILHDAVLAPVVFAASAIAYRITGPRLRRTLAAVLLIGGSAVLVALPEFLLPPGNPNPTVHPLNYARGLAVVGGAVIAAALLYLLIPPLVGRLRERRRARRRARDLARRAVGPAAGRAAGRAARTEDVRESLQTEEASIEPSEPGANPGPDA
jgi:hypothetical protein